MKRIFDFIEMIARVYIDSAKRRSFKVSLRKIKESSWLQVWMLITWASIGVALIVNHWLDFLWDEALSSKASFALLTAIFGILPGVLVYLARKRKFESFTWHRYEVTTKEKVLSFIATISLFLLFVLGIHLYHSG